MIERIKNNACDGQAFKNNKMWGLKKCSIHKYNLSPIVFPNKNMGNVFRLQDLLQINFSWVVKTSNKVSKFLIQYHERN